MSETLVHRGPGFTNPAPVGQFVDPVWIRMIGQSMQAVAFCRIDVLTRSAGNKIDQFQFTCVAQPQPRSMKLGGFFLPEPLADGMRSVSMQVERAELVEKLRALADAIEK